MTQEKKNELLKEHGWIVTCESPFEIEKWSEDGMVCVGTATGEGAELVVDELYNDGIEFRKD